jgi:hypothetical protein
MAERSTHPQVVTDRAGTKGLDLVLALQKGDSALFYLGDNSYILLG